MCSDVPRFVRVYVSKKGIEDVLNWALVCTDVCIDVCTDMCTAVCADVCRCVIVRTELQKYVYW